MPLLLLHGESDERVSVEDSRALAAGIERAGGTVRLVTVPGGDHDLTGYDVRPEMRAWLERYLGKP